MTRPGCPRFFWIVLCTLASGASTAGAEPAPGIEDLYRLDRLPRFKQSVEAASVSSYDRTGGNDDGFSGKYSFVRKEPGGLVIADLKGPGVVYRIWTPTPTDDPVEFFFDGENEPRIRVKFRDLFLGKQAPFLEPLCGYGAGGFFSYVPLPFARSLKVLVRAKKVQFYQINYARYGNEAQVRTFDPNASTEYIAHREKARKLFASAGSDITAYTAPPGAATDVVRSRATLNPGKSVTLFETDAPGRIVGLRISPASALAGKARDLILRISYDGDGEPAVLCPAGDFFGYAWGEPAMTSLLAGTKDDVSYCYFPMPFDRSAKVEIISQRRSGPPVELRAEVAVAPVPRSPAEGKFYALWRRENPTTAGKPFTFIETRGRGHIVGCVLQCQNMDSGKTLYFEGDDQTTIDGKLVIHGTGSEDFFNGGWYDVPDRWEKRISFPLSGCLGYQKHLGRTGAYRIFIGDAYAYRESILQTIEHGGTGNSIPTDYCGLTYLYSKERPTARIALPPQPERKVIDFTRIIFPAWWQIPIQAFCFNNATLGRRGEKLDGKDVRFLSLRATARDWFGPAFISLVCDLPVAGTYTVSLEVVKGPAQGRVQLFSNEVPVGKAADLYAPTRRKSAPVALGDLELRRGPNNVMLKLVGKNEKSSGLGLDVVHVICERKEGGAR